MHFLTEAKDPNEVADGSYRTDRIFLDPRHSTRQSQSAPRDTSPALRLIGDFTVLDHKLIEDKTLSRHSISNHWLVMYAFNFFLVSLLASSTQAFRSAFAPGNQQRDHRYAFKSSSSLCMSTIAVIGASGLTAQECVYQALKEGDSVIGLTRNPSNVCIPQGSGGDDAGKPLSDPKLSLIGGDVTNKADVEKIFENDIDGVIIALGGKTSDVGETMLTDGTKNVIDCMKAKGVKRLAVVTSIGAGDSENQAPFFFKVLMWTAMKKIFLVSENCAVRLSVCIHFC